ncbi:MlaD family protein [Daejeonella lutea]|uniref:Phospholipid/cholesterol/gamma-HCH transport system substrate-binding protein n=1 Tax=Daejeonella lutea TaxID=572036 RepID=A0A1T5AHS0_9SPHI|nr:MlaD family protein [Daejeonella lutea]SKB34524.1 phospholipid/cholesterol/gamma-HCH transport system substrate-binding protein [Daejeonella lutea]
MKITNETKVGVLAAVAIAILIIGYSFLKGNDVFSSENEFYARYDRVDGLAISKPVLVNGYQIGRVSDLTLQPNGQILAQFKIDPEYAIPKNTIAKLESTDLLGGKAIVFELGTGSDFAKDGDTLNANIQKNLTDQIEPIQKKAEQIIARMDSVLTSVNATLSPEFQRNFDRSFASIARTLETMEGTTKTVDGLVTSQSVKIAAIMSNLESITGNFKNNNAKITNIMSNFEKLSDDVAKANFAQTIAEANKAVADLQVIVNKVNTGQGTLGQLINDEKMYNNLNNAAANLDKLMIDLKANPKRYVSFSVFGGKKD